MMTRKDYVATAEILSLFTNVIDREILEDMISEFSFMFSQDNQNFNRKKFAEAVLEKEKK